MSDAVPIAPKPAKPEWYLESLDRGLRLMDVLWDQFALGMLPREIVTAARESPSYVSRALRTLEAGGWVERVPETERWRPSVRMARRLAQVQRDMERAQQRLGELQTRINTPL